MTALRLTRAVSDHRTSASGNSAFGPSNLRVGGQATDAHTIAQSPMPCGAPLALEPRLRQSLRHEVAFTWGIPVHSCRWVKVAVVWFSPEFTMGILEDGLRNAFAREGLDLERFRLPDLLSMSKSAVHRLAYSGLYYEVLRDISSLERLAGERPATLTGQVLCDMAHDMRPPKDMDPHCPGGIEVAPSTVLIHGYISWCCVD